MCKKIDLDYWFFKYLEVHNVVSVLLLNQSKIVLTLNAVKITRYIRIEIKISNIDYIIMINKTYNTKALSQLVGLEDKMK